MELEPFFDSFYQECAPTLGEDIVLKSILPSFLRHVLDQRDTAFFRQLEGFDVICSASTGLSVLTPAVQDLLRSLQQSLEAKMRSTPPFPTTSDHWALGVLRLCANDASGALESFGNADAKMMARGVGLAAKVEALFLLRRFDDLVASVIAAETSDGVLGTVNDGEEKKKSFAAKALHLVRRGSDAPNESEPLLQTDDDAKMLHELPLLRRALTYHRLDLQTGNDVYKFKCSQDFAALFQTTARPDLMTALLKASKARITENMETKCALLHQAAQANPRMWELPYLSSVARHRGDAKAMIDCEAALRLNNADSSKILRMHKILLMIEQRRVAEAAKELHPLVLTDPGNVWLGLLRGRARMLMDDWEGAEADLRRVVTTLEKSDKPYKTPKSRLCCELAAINIRRAKDPECERLGLKGELLQSTEAMLRSSLLLDKNHQAVKHKMLSQLCSDENVAAVEQWEATRLFAAQERREDTMWRETVVQELRTSRKAFKQLNLHKEVARVATLGLSLFNDAFWTYCLARANFNLNDSELAAHLCRQGLALAPKEKHRIALEALLSKCVPLKEDSSALRPVAVPPLELGSLKTVASRGRRSKTVAGEAPHKNSFSGAGSPKRAVARKTRSSLTRSQQEEDARAVVENKRLVQSEQHEDGKIVGTVSDIATNTIEQQPQEEEEDTGQEQHQQQHQQQEQEQQEQQQQQQHDAEEQQQQQEQPQQHETQVQEQEVPTVREKEMLAEIASLKEKLANAHALIEQLYKGGLMSE